MWRASVVLKPDFATAPPAKEPARSGITGEAAPPQQNAPPKSQNARSRGMHAADREFLPAAIEILETPPSPIATSLLWLICLAAAGALAWSYFGMLDVYAVAPGQIQPSGRSKVVQPLESGKIAAVYVKNGSIVKEGELLIELDATDAVADRDAQEGELEAINAEIARRKAAIGAAATIGREGPLAINFPPGTDEPVRKREEQVLNSELAALASNRTSLEAQLAEKVATKKRLLASITARENIITLSRERVQMRETLSAKGAGSRAQTIEALQQLESQLQPDVADRHQVIETEAAMHSLERRIEELESRFIADHMQKIAEAERKRDNLSQSLIKAKSREERTKLRSPINGTVQQLTVTTIGQVVASGQALLTVVPQQSPIVVDCLLLNRDIGFVEIGQSAVVKVEAFPFTRYGTIDGVVTNVSRDGVDERDRSTLGDAMAVTKPQSAGTGAGTLSQQLVFPATISLSRNNMMINGKAVPLLPGMAVAVEIKTGHRRVLDYLLSPIATMVAQSGHER